MNLSSLLLIPTLITAVAGWWPFESMNSPTLNETFAQITRISEDNVSSLTQIVHTLTLLAKFSSNMTSLQAVIENKPCLRAQLHTAFVAEDAVGACNRTIDVYNYAGTILAEGVDPTTPNVASLFTLWTAQSIEAGFRCDTLSDDAFVAYVAGLEQCKVEMLSMGLDYDSLMKAGRDTVKRTKETMRAAKMCALAL
ncbi:hypothetical protein LTR97_004952 [Elasticomyces elasticus]|uniref:Pectinesterase inhibitor domain-containing protein n=1 Tax=Elasticomyces elasticus TaxID=574655 RepID=A0AAN8A3N7_9PEZI|nr:hypothetical protein LTR97_004952 [Elasticomyces elasticus]KAK5724252.1 hypothetical protein LTR15_004296 [Elasticomyces elasticus]